MYVKVTKNPTKNSQPKTSNAVWSLKLKNPTESLSFILFKPKKNNKESAAPVAKIYATIFTPTTVQGHFLSIPKEIEIPAWNWLPEML